MRLFLVLLLAAPTALAQPLYLDVTDDALPTIPFNQRATMDIEVADLDGDDDLDIVLACEGCENVLLINNGDGTFADGRSRFPDSSPYDSEDIAIAEPVQHVALRIVAADYDIGEPGSNRPFDVREDLQAVARVLFPALRQVQRHADVQIADREGRRINQGKVQHVLTQTTIHGQRSLANDKQVIAVQTADRVVAGLCGASAASSDGAGTGKTRLSPNSIRIGGMLRI